MTRFHRVRPRVRSVVAIALIGLWAVLAPDGGRAAQDPSDAIPYPSNDRPVAITEWTDEIPAHLAVVDGAAQLERDGTLETAEENTPLLSGDRLRTDRGRVEVLFSDGSALDIDEFSNVDLLSESLVRLTSGRIRLSIARTLSGPDYRVDSAGTTTWIRASGEYRITLLDPRATDPEVRLTVLRGLAELTSPFGRTLVRAGSEARTTARTEPSLPYVMSAATADEFERWVSAERDYRLGSRSAQYLPAELRYYGGTFDHEGAWEYDTGYGYVWYPRVAVDWQPYYNGHWSYFGSFGWTWIGGGRWAWPTHHYGRWGYQTGRWFWIPDRHWAPAWVSWAYAPGYVSWCPLGFNNRPVFAVSTITYHDTWGRRGWTVMPSRSFGHNVAVPRYASALRTAPLPAGSRFVSREGGPVRPAMARGDARPLGGPTPAARSSALARTGRSPESTPAVGMRSASPARTIESGSRSATASGIDDRATNARTARPRTETPSDPRSDQRTLDAPRAAGAVSRSTPAGAIDDPRAANSRVARPREQADVWRSPNVQYRTPQASTSAPVPQEPSADRGAYARRAPQSQPGPQPGRMEPATPQREPARTNPPERTRSAEPRTTTPAPSRSAPGRSAPSQPASSDRGSGDRPSRSAPSQGSDSSGGGRAQPRPR